MKGVDDCSATRATVMSHAQKLVAHAASSAENIRQSKAGAEAAIREVFGEVGWSVAVTWASPSSEGAKIAKAAKQQTYDHQDQGM